ncbi:uncharacterized protein SCHCODRAFT_02645571 [Schizophyllum commune H4-8]|uniref:uncharacterized protein n=1 Tax=Schizophyllum commune (strain H4-8 / FGSC 9210) TaxID=578458 RepID=UPI002160F20F|nr:uncharacterized protein SCHCODRAFT_02645571 [Schizophyllum commune H4-8]KAI5884838.1 hypothetical protein SCHCODRAFT_02645571 [Schizophyllum commune H4-8]
MYAARCGTCVIGGKGAAVGVLVFLASDDGAAGSWQLVFPDSDSKTPTLSAGLSSYGRSGYYDSKPASEGQGISPGRAHGDVSYGKKDSAPNSR